jgi:hypothetical protein
MAFEIAEMLRSDDMFGSNSSKPEVFTGSASHLLIGFSVVWLIPIAAILAVFA